MWLFWLVLANNWLVECWRGSWFVCIPSWSEVPEGKRQCYAIRMNKLTGSTSCIGRVATLRVTRRVNRVHRERVVMKIRTTWNILMKREVINRIEIETLTITLFSSSFWTATTRAFVWTIIDHWRMSGKYLHQVVDQSATIGQSYFSHWQQWEWNEWPGRDCRRMPTD